MKKLLLIFLGFIVMLVAFAQLNFEQAVSKASQVATDGEIQEVMAQHGYTGDVFGKITVLDKMDALINVLGHE